MPQRTSRRVLVAGGAGFIGMRLCLSLLASGHDVTCLDNFCTSDPSRGEELRVAGVHIAVSDVAEAPAGDWGLIFHLASPASPIHYRRLPIETMWANALGSRRLLQLSVETGARFVLASTSEVYGDPLVHPQPECYWGNVNPIGPRACYDESKRFAEALTSEHVRSFGADATIVRIFNTYGPGMDLRDGRAVPEFICAGLDGAPIKVHGDGAQTRSLCYVDDLVLALQLVASDDDAAGEVINLGNPEEISVVELAELIRRLTGNRSPIEFVDPAPDDPARRRPDISKLRARYDWQPSTNLEAGLTLTVRDIASRLRATR